MASPAESSWIFCFGPFELNAASGELRKSGIPLKIYPQAFRLLLLLAERSGQIVTRKEIQRHLWAEHTFVDFERGINFCINQIRAALGDDAEDPKYIQTLPRRGYRFIAALNRDTLPDPAAMSHKGPVLACPMEAGNGDAPTNIAKARGPLKRAAVSPGVWVIVSALFVLTSVCVLVLSRRLSPHLRSMDLPQPEAVITQLTANSKEASVVSGSISPDGKYLAYSDSAGRILVKLIPTGEIQNFPEPPTTGAGHVDREIGPWFPDSTRFLINVHTTVAPVLNLAGWNSQGTSVWMASILRAPPQELRDNAEAIAISPDGSAVAFSTSAGEYGDREIWLMDSSGQRARKLYDAAGDGALRGLAWSRDGKRVIYILGIGAVKPSSLQKWKPASLAKCFAFPPQKNPAALSGCPMDALSIPPTSRQPRASAAFGSCRSIRTEECPPCIHDESQAWLDSASPV